MNTKIKVYRNILQVAVVFALMFAALSAVAVPATLAADPAPKNTQNIFYLADPSYYGNNIAAPPEGTAQEKFAALVWGIIQNLRYIIGALAIALVVYSGFRMVTGWGKEDVYAKERTNILFAIIGLTIVGLAGEMANIFQVACPPAVAGQPTQPCVMGGFLKNPNAIVRTATLFNQRTQLIIVFIKYFVGALSVFMIVRNGLRMITMGQDEDKIALDKKNLTYNIIGLGLIIFANTAINKVLYKVDLTRYPSVGGAAPAVDAVRGVQEIVGFTNFVVSLVGPIAVLALFAGGVLYITAGGEEEKMGKAKKLITAALIGLIIIYGAFALVNTFIAGQFPQSTEATTTETAAPTTETTI